MSDRPLYPQPCGWCGHLVYSPGLWQRHYDGACINNPPGRTDAILNAYHSATAKQREGERG